MTVLVSLLRLLVGFVCIAVLVLTMLPILVILLPWRVGRIRVTNAWGTAMGASVLWCSGCKITFVGREHVSADRPAIYAFNHTSTLDAFTTIWLTPSGTVGVAKKEVLFYPFYGQAWWLAGHVLLDRGRTDRAKAALKRTVGFLRGNALSLCILPEGTRAKDGRLQPFKKGVVHIALDTKLPIVPVVTAGLHKTWNKGSLRITPAEVKITFLPPIETASWTEERMAEQIEELRAPFLATLPPEQRPLPS
jgi:1-acyl-sn-glycerol-3-phosphate acyltransferase